MQAKDFSNLLGLVKLIGGKYIIVEDGKPVAVLMDYKEFDNLVAPTVTAELAKRASRLGRLEEDINQKITQAQISDLREEVISPDFVPEVPDEIRIEPLDQL